MEMLDELVDLHLEFLGMKPRFPSIKKEEKQPCLFDMEDVLHLDSNTTPVPHVGRFVKSEPCRDGFNVSSRLPPHLPPLSFSGHSRLSHLDHSFYRKCDFCLRSSPHFFFIYIQKIYIYYTYIYIYRGPSQLLTLCSNSLHKRFNKES